MVNSPQDIGSLIRINILLQDMTLGNYELALQRINLIK